MENFEINIEVKSKLSITSQDIDDLMVTALEGGINYWCEKAEVVSCPEEYEFASDVISRGGELRLHDGIEKHTLTRENFLKGVKQYCEEWNYTSIEELMDSHDADTADIIVQYAIFGEQTYA